MIARDLRKLSRAAARTGVTSVGKRVDERSAAWRARLTRGLTVFIFHDVTDSPSEFHRSGRSYTTPGVFEAQLAWIESRFEIVAPVDLPQLGGERDLPVAAALLTFDDAWAGTYREGLRILAERGLPALCFVNMGTVAGEMDLAAVRRYERDHPTAGPPLLEGWVDLESSARVLAQVRERYQGDRAFRDYQGELATTEDLERAARRGNVWFGSHLYNHWDLRRIDADLFRASFARNAEALSAYPNRVSAFATPHGYAGGAGLDPAALAAEVGVGVLFTGTGNQNRNPAGPVMDRLALPPEPCDERAWWYATHRRRVIGSAAS